MSRTISRFGIGLAAVALVAGSSFALSGTAFAADGDLDTLGATNSSAPPTDAPTYDPALESSTTTFAAGNWGAGFTATGTGFAELPEGATVTVYALSGALNENPTAAVKSVQDAGGLKAFAAGDGIGEGVDDFVEYGETPVTPDASGNFSLTNWVPQNLATPLPEGHIALLVAAIDVEGDITDAVVAPFEITAFVPLAQGITVTPGCSSPEAIFTDGVSVSAAGFGQGEGITEWTRTADGTKIGDNVTGNADLTGTYASSFTLFSQSVADGTQSPIDAGTYTEVVQGANGLTLTADFTVGDCTTPADVVVDDSTPADPAAAGPQLANTGSGDAGILLGGSAALLLAGAVLVAARRRAASAK